MSYPSVFDSQTTANLLKRINKLQPTSQPEWGKMGAAQMLAHCCVAYDITYGKTEVKYNWFMRKMLGWFVKPIVVGEKPYEKNTRTAPVFIIEDERDFAAEKARLTEYIQRVEADGEAFFKGKASPSFGVLTTEEWSNQFWKHLDHHLRQFGV